MVSQGAEKPFHNVDRGLKPLGTAKDFSVMFHALLDMN